MNIRLKVDPTTLTEGGFAVARLIFETDMSIRQLDIQYSELSPIPLPSSTALDLLLLASAVYTVDKVVPRRSAKDCWTREIALSIPVSAPDEWTAVRGELENCISFLTGDQWIFTFTHRSFALGLSKRSSRSLSAPIRPAVVSLFSGGLDSLIGAIDWLETHSQLPLLLVGHHDGQIAGPFADQRNLLPLLKSTYPGRVGNVLVRVGHYGKGKETTFRSRSFLFIALGIYTAFAYGPDVPLLIHENGTIALNVPLTPSRRGSCSTRTAHPHYLGMLQSVLCKLGIPNPLVNPFILKTKGEVVSECANPALLIDAARLSVSCAKRGHKRNWIRREAKACGQCMPCIYRRAALHCARLDTEAYGRDICAGEVDLNDRSMRGPNDFRACLSFLRRNLSAEEICQLLLANGSLDISNLQSYGDVVHRAMDEIRCLLRDKGRTEIKRLAGLGGGAL